MQTPITTLIRDFVMYGMKTQMLRWAGSEDLKVCKLVMHNRLTSIVLIKFN